jgi:hypothetical protein
MDKYDIIFIWRYLKDLFVDDRKYLPIKYLKWKKDLLIREYGILRNRRSFQYHKRQEEKLRKSNEDQKKKREKFVEKNKVNPKDFLDSLKMEKK